MSSNPSPTRASAGTLWRRAQPTTAQGPRFGIVGSLAFHALIAAAALFSFHNYRAPEETHAVPVDLVTIAAETNVAAQAPPAPPEPEKIEIPVPEAVPPPEPEMAEPAPAPDAKMPDFDVAKDEPKPPPKPPEKPKPTKKTQQEDFNALLNKLTAAPKRPKNAKPGQRVIQGVGAGTAMTANIADALRSQIRQCWSLQSYPPNPQDAIVDYDLRLTNDGRVASAELLTRGGNAYTRAAAEAASRAIYSCQPYHLPPDQYQVWSEINPLRFDPRQMLEQ
jgi:outer membrane biosynthesis protein TonB